MRPRTALVPVPVPALAFACVVSACAGGWTEVHQVVLREPSPPTAKTVEVYVETQTPPRAFWEIAMLQAIGHGDDANMEDVTRALAVHAASLGCDAVVRVHVDQGYAMAHAYGVCARWAAGAPPPPPVAPPASAPAAAPEPAPAPASAPPPAPAAAPDGGGARAI